MKWSAHIVMERGEEIEGAMKLEEGKKVRKKVFLLSA